MAQWQSDHIVCTWAWVKFACARMREFRDTHTYTQHSTIWRTGLWSSCFSTPELMGNGFWGNRNQGSFTTVVFWLTFQIAWVPRHRRSVFFWSLCFSEVPGTVQRGHSSMWRQTWEKVAWRSSGNYFQMTFQNCSSIPPHPLCGNPSVTMKMPHLSKPFQAGHHRLSKTHTGYWEIVFFLPFANMSQEDISVFVLTSFFFFFRNQIKESHLPTTSYVCSSFQHI